MKTVYVALLTEGEERGSLDISFLTCVMTVQETREELDEYIMEYFGISKKRNYLEPAECLGFQKVEYSDFEDDLVGNWTFRSKDGQISKVYVYIKTLGEKIF